MSFEDDFLDMMVDTITWDRATGVDGYGNLTYDAPVTIQCRIAPKFTKVLDPHGNEVVSKVSIYTAGDYPISPSDRITLPNGEHDPVLRVTRPPDGDGPHHVTVSI